MIIELAKDKSLKTVLLKSNIDENTMALVKSDASIDLDRASSALDMLSIDKNGFDHMDRRLLMTMIEKFEGGPVGVDSLAAAISEERYTIEDVLEPYLIQQGFIMRTPRGRVVTQYAYRHFGIKPSQAIEDLFSNDQTH